MMGLAKDILMKFAQEAARDISNKTIIDLQNITDTLSGDDSELSNAWEEICVQVQYEHSFFWDTYDDVARSLILHYVENLKDNEKQALWFQTEEGWDWFYDNEQESDESPPIFNGDIVQYIIDGYLYYEAGSWSNDNISAYLDRQY